MKWMRARFGDNDVWVQIDDAGDPVVERGRVPMRYQLRAGAKVYSGSRAKLTIQANAEIRSLDDDAAPAAGPKKKGGRRGFGSAGTRSAAQASAAKKEATRLLRDIPEGTVVAYTDGSCRGNPGPAGAGAVVELPDGRTVHACRSLGEGTNNIAELSAVGLVLDVLDEYEIASDAPVALLTDSDYTNGVLARGWKAKANRPLITSLRERLSSRPGVELHWVAGHVGIPGNEQADALANLGVDGRTCTELASE